MTRRAVGDDEGGKERWEGEKAECWERRNAGERGEGEEGEGGKGAGDEMGRVREGAWG